MPRTRIHALSLHAPSWAAALGDAHPLTRSTIRSGQCVTATSVAAVVLVVPLAGAVVGYELAMPLAVAALAVFGLALVAAGCLHSAVRSAAVQAIAEGHEGLTARCVQAQRRRLLRPATQRRLARSLNDIALMTATRPPGRPRGPLDLRRLRPLADEIAATAALVATADLVHARGCAACERLLSVCGSPIWGGTLNEVRGALADVRQAIDASTSPAHAPR